MQCDAVSRCRAEESLRRVPLLVHGDGPGMGSFTFTAAAGAEGGEARRRADAVSTARRMCIRSGR
jgi:hypothetical protein